MNNYQSARISHDIRPNNYKNYQNAEFLYFARKLQNSRILHNCPINIFFPNLGGHVPPLSPVSYTYAKMHRQMQQTATFKKHNSTGVNA